MRLSRAYIPLASEDRTHSQAIYTYPHNSLVPHFLPGFINLRHFRHSRWRNPVRLSKMGLTCVVAACASIGPVGSSCSVFSIAYRARRSPRALSPYAPTNEKALLPSVNFHSFGLFFIAVITVGPYR